MLDRLRQQPIKDRTQPSEAIDQPDRQRQLAGTQVSNNSAGHRYQSASDRTDKIMQPGDSHLPLVAANPPEQRPGRGERSTHPGRVELIGKNANASAPDER